MKSAAGQYARDSLRQAWNKGTREEQESDTSFMQRLNFGCGKRFAKDWTNIDFHSTHPQVKAVNLLNGFSFPDRSFDVVYSSHVLEHFTQDQALFLLQEAYRVLKPQGIVRIVVPDLEGLCKEYLRVLDLPDGDRKKNDQYEWIVIELLDQMVRAETYGEMGEFYTKLNQGEDSGLREYVQSRVGKIPDTSPVKLSWQDQLQQLTFQEIYSKFIYLYLKVVSALLPKNLRSMVFVETMIGERHRWMYDSYGLQRMLEKVGFSQVQSVTYQESAIPNFNADCLDCSEDGSAYKVNSIYVEARR
jgi:predicted SAM-dependent methyltransferase